MVPWSCLSGAVSSAKPEFGFQPSRTPDPAKGQNSFTSPTASNPTHQWGSAVHGLMELCKVMKWVFHRIPSFLQAALILLGSRAKPSKTKFLFVIQTPADTMNGTMQNKTKQYKIELCSGQGAAAISPSQTMPAWKVATSQPLKS